MFIVICPYCQEAFKTPGTLAFQVSGDNQDQRVQCIACKRHASGRVVDGQMVLSPIEDVSDEHIEQQQLLTDLYGP